MQAVTGLLLLFDGWTYMQLIPTPTILDNLIAAGKLPPLIAVFFSHLQREERMREMAFNRPLIAWVQQELLAWIQQQYSITSDPSRRVVGGVCMGAIAAMLTGLHTPDLFGSGLCQSGSFQHKLPEDTEHERLAREIAERAFVPLRFHLDIGLLECESLGFGMPDGGPDALLSNRHPRNILRAKGYDVDYVEFAGGHDPVCWPGVLPDALMALLSR